MTRTGKCDTCRVRKVKCDEQKPKCKACQKRDRDCTYSFGRVSAFVVEDPTQFSKHGKPKAAAVLPLQDNQETDVNYVQKFEPAAESAQPRSFPVALRQISSRETDSGYGEFLTLSTLTHDKLKAMKKPSSQQKRKLQLYLNQLRQTESLVVPRQFVSNDTALAARYLNLLGSRPIEEQPFAIVGTWVATIPSRIGSSPAVDFAVEYLLQSCSYFQEPSFSAQRAALAMKGKALKALQLAVGDDIKRRSYDTTLAMKLHFMSEVFMGLKNLYHAVHAAGISDILQAGPPSDIDHDHYWDFFDCTYIEDVGEAMMSGRTSIYDQDLYLNITNAANIPSDTPVAFRASVMIMHVFIQLPRLVCRIRHASNHPDDTKTVASAIVLAETLWSLVPPITMMEEVIQASITIVEKPPSPKIADIVSSSYDFDSLQNCMLISKFWMLQVLLAGAIQTLFQNFPSECTASLLPPLLAVQETDYNAALELARCIRYALDFCPALPLAPLRIYTTFQVSLGTWYRRSQYFSASCRNFAPETSAEIIAYVAEQIEIADRMETWVASTANDVHEIWKVQRVNRKFLRAAVVDMAGGAIPDWLPLRIKFEFENGMMVTNLEYDLVAPIYEEILGASEIMREWRRKTKTASPFDADTNNMPTGPMLSDQKIGGLSQLAGESPEPKEDWEVANAEVAPYSREIKYAQSIASRVPMEPSQLRELLLSSETD